MVEIIQRDSEIIRQRLQRRRPGVGARTFEDPMQRWLLNASSPRQRGGGYTPLLQEEGEV